ncbi:Protocadherin-11 X-linked [Echinococcus granulosus]|uniref:Protocadherin-11 X-linked n=1 Tax=Echinococcus granulosus TaxID=6210 RepID=W6VBL6_ECHGR|nr:Protocadherin-11 X-linked [Echinococcus granulosus]EUB64229.1 Protocadherin-11 X-linked [Echinococcus granulosus]
MRFCSMKSSYFLFLVSAFCVTAVERILFSVEEEEKPGSLVGILLPKLSSRLRSYKDRMNFQIIQKGDSKYFRITPQDGRITLAQVIDRESLCHSTNTHGAPHSLSSAEGQCQLRFTVSILRQGTSEIMEMVQVTVNVLDVNDNNCKFEPSDKQTVYIPEDTSVDSNYRIPLYIPSDPDASIMNRIDPRSIALKSADDIDSARYFNLHVTETSSTDKPATLHLLLTRKLDYETLSIHKLVVTASDASRRSASTCSLQLTVQVVDVNDHPPRFAKKRVHLSLNENTPVGSLVHQLQAIDQDKGLVFSKLIFSLETYTPDDVTSYFDVHPFNGSVLLKQRLSYRKKRKFEFSVVVRNPTDAEIITRSNDGKPQLKISRDIQVETTMHDVSQIIIDVIDVNDEAPAISFYAPDGQSELSIEENTALLPSDFGVVSVTDGDSGDNGKVECALADNVTDFFRLVKMTSGDGMTEDGREALFKLSAIHNFDREEQVTMALAIFCRDFGVPPRNSSKNLVVQIRDINDNSPVFDQDYLELNVTEDSDPSRQSNNYVIGRVLAHDLDEGANAEIAYDLIQSNVPNLFTVDPKTGVFSSNGELDRETNDQHQFLIVAKDSGTPQLSSSIIVTIHVLDFNDEPPVFALPDFEFSATEGVKRNTLIGIVNITDADLGVNRELSFRILTNDLPAHYPVTSSESLQHYTWRNEQTASLPYRLESRFNQIKNGYEVSIFTDGELHAEAGTHHMEYADNGSQATSFHSFYIVAEDGGTPKRISRARIIVRLLDINDNAPVFNFPSEKNATVNVSCNEYVGYPFTQHRSDLCPRRCKLMNEAHSSSQMVARLEYAEVCAIYHNHLLIHMCDHQQDRLSAVCHIYDSVLATDADAGINGTVQYYLGNSQAALSLPDYSEQTLFQVNRTNGQISLKKPLSLSDVGHEFTVYIVASDMGAEPLQTQAMLTVLVDKSIPKGTSTVRPSDPSEPSKSISDSMINLFIIIFIVAAAFIIATVLLTAVCIVLSKSRQNSASLHALQEGILILISTTAYAWIYARIAVRLLGNRCFVITAIVLPVSLTSAKKHSTPIATDDLLQDPNNVHILPDLGPLPASYALVHSEGKVYRAIPLVSTARWSPTSSSAATVVYATINPIMSAVADEFGAPLSGRLATEAIGEAHGSELPLLVSSVTNTVAADRTITSRGGLSSSPIARVARPTHGLSPACEDAIWVGSQEELFDKHECRRFGQEEGIREAEYRGSRQDPSAPLNRDYLISN